MDTNGVGSPLPMTRATVVAERAGRYGRAFTLLMTGTAGGSDVHGTGGRISNSMPSSSVGSFRGGHPETDC